MPEALQSDELFSRLVAPGLPWREVKVLASVDSTNAEAVRRPRAWSVVVAEEQRAGRGRLDRVWSTPPGRAVTMSATVPMSSGRAADWGWLPLVAGMAVGTTLTEVAGVRAGWKWPNDVLAWGPGEAPEEGRKICGVLCQGVPGAGASDEQGLAVVGIGVNVAQSQAELPIAAATSLALLGAPMRREDVVVAVLERLAELYAGWLAGGTALGDLRGRYRRGCLTLGRRVELHRPGAGTVLATATDVAEDGSLLARLADGTVVQHAAGDVVHARLADH